MVPNEKEAQNNNIFYGCNDFKSFKAIYKVHLQLLLFLLFIDSFNFRPQICADPATGGDKPPGQAPTTCSRLFQNIHIAKF